MACGALQAVLAGGKDLLPVHDPEHHVLDVEVLGATVQRRELTRLHSQPIPLPVSYTHLRAHETSAHL
eukprot:4525234-Alexandrium_andersonii.AAC.1